MAFSQIACFLPLIAASITAIRGVVVSSNVYGAFHVENVFILYEDEFAISDHKFSTVFDQNIDFVERVANTTVSQISLFRLIGLRMDTHTLIECLLENIFVSYQLGQTLNLITLLCRGANDTVAQCHVMLNSRELVFIANVARLARGHPLTQSQLVDFDTFHFLVESVTALRPMHRIEVVLITVAFNLVINICDFSLCSICLR